MKRMSNNLIQLGDLKPFFTCTNHIRTILEFRHFGQMTQKSRSLGTEHAWASNIEKKHRNWWRRIQMCSILFSYF